MDAPTSEGTGGRPAGPCMYKLEGIGREQLALWNVVRHGHAMLLLHIFYLALVQ